MEKIKSFFQRPPIKNTLIFLGLVLFFLAFRWNSFNAPWERDEGAYAYSAWILDQGLNPYFDSIDNKPPLVFYTYWLAYKINPDALWPPKILSSIFIFGTILLLGLIARKEFGRGMGYAAMFLSVPMLAFFILTPFAANTENFMLFPLIGALTLFVYWKDGDKKWPWFLFGILSALAIFYKPICLCVLAFIFLFWLARNFSLYRRISYSIVNTALFLSGTAIVFILLLFPFLKRDGGKSVWEWVVWWNFYNVKSLGLTWESFQYIFINFLAYWWVLILLLLFYIYKRPKEFWFFYLSLFLLTILTVYKAILHNYLLFIPFWILIATHSIKIISDWLYPKLKDKYSWDKIKIFLTVGIISTITLPVANSLTFSPQRLSIMVYGYQPFEESVAVAKYVRENSNPDDYVFMNGSEPEIMYYAKRKNNSRFLTYFPMYMESPKKDEYERIYQEELRKNTPKLIVYIDTGFGIRFVNIDYIDQEMKDNYHFIGAIVREKEKVYWIENIPEKGKYINTVSLYKRNSN